MKLLKELHMKGAVLALATVLALPSLAQAGGDWDFSFGLGYSGHHRHGHYNVGVHYAPRYYHRPYRHRVYVYEPAYVPAPVYVAPGPVYVRPPVVKYKYRYYAPPVRVYRYERRYYR